MEGYFKYWGKARTGEIQAAHKRSRGTYGPERLKEDMKEHGVDAGIYRIRKLRKKLGIKCKQTKKFRATTDSDHKLPVADNLLEQRFEATEPNKVWVSDIRTLQGEKEGI